MSHRIVAVTPAGRERYLELLSHYVLRDPGIAEWHLWDNCRSPKDRQYIEALASRHGKIKLVRIEGADGTNRSVNRFYSLCNDDRAFYIKLDDDIVYLPDRFAGAFYRRAMEERDRCLWWSPLVINNAICSWLIKHHSKVELADWLSCQANDPCGWRDASFAERLHGRFIFALRNGGAGPFRVPSFDVSLSRFSINCLGFFGTDVATLDGRFCPPDVDDEEWLSACLPSILDRPGRVVGDLVVAHFSFFTQERELLKAGLLDRYYDVAGRRCPPYSVPARPVRQHVSDLEGAEAIVGGGLMGAALAAAPDIRAEFGPAGSAVVRNFASLLMGRAGSQGLNFLTNAYLARRIAPAGFGAVGLAQSIVSYLGLLSDSGLSVIALRDGAQDPSRLDGLIRSITGLRLALSCALVPVGLLAAQFLPFSEPSRNVLRVFALSLPLQALAVDWVFRALQRMHYAAITQLATAALTLLLTVALVHNPRHLERVPWLGVATGAAAVALSLYLLGRTGHGLSVSFQFGRSKRYLAQSLPLCAASFAVTLYMQANFLILGAVHGDAEVGMYAAASKIAAVVFTITSLYFAAMAPALMELSARSSRDAAHLLAESVRVTAAGACGLVAIGAAGSGSVLRWVFGAPFLPAINALAILLCSGGVVAVTSNWGQLAIASHRERLLLWATALGGCANLIVCAALVRRYGCLGAAIGNLAAEVVVGAAVIGPWPREVGLGALRTCFKPALVAAGALSLGSRLEPLGGLWAASAAAGLYVAGLWATRTITSRDISRVCATFSTQP